MGEMTVIQMMYRQRRAEELAVRQSEKPDFFSGVLHLVLDNSRCSGPRALVRHHTAC
jgi:hypothetical protein